jgi:pteridine reductase
MTTGARSLDTKWALVTGGARRVGACIARALHAAGAGIAIHYRDSGAMAQALAAELNKVRPASAFAETADLLELGSIHSMVDAIVGRTGRLDILVNNASSFYPTPLGSITQQQWEDLIGTNMRAPLFLSQSAMPHLKKARGVIINLIDIHAARPLRDHAVYGAAKAGLAMLTRAMARDLAPDVRVNGVAPGAVLWPDDGISERTKESIIRQIPMKRAGRPEDIAGCVLYLVRDADYVTGQIIVVDGGRSIGW